MSDEASNQPGEAGWSERRRADMFVNPTHCSSLDSEDSMNDDALMWGTPLTRKRGRESPQADDLLDLLEEPESMPPLWPGDGAIGSASVSAGYSTSRADELDDVLFPAARYEALALIHDRGEEPCSSSDDDDKSVVGSTAIPDSDDSSSSAGGTAGYDAGVRSSSSSSSSAAAASSASTHGDNTDYVSYALAYHFARTAATRPRIAGRYAMMHDFFAVFYPVPQ